MRNLTQFVGMLMLVAGGASSLPAQDTAPSGMAILRAAQEVSTDLVKRVEPSVVSITRTNPTNLIDNSSIFDAFPGGGRELLNSPHNPEFVPVNFGTGVVIAAGKAGGQRNHQRFVLTNFHLVYGSRSADAKPDAPDRLYVQLASKHIVPASIVAADKFSDLAVLKLDLAGSGVDPKSVPPLELGQAEDVRKGQFVFVLGNPYAIARDGSASVSWGLISNISRKPAVSDNKDGTLTEQATIHHYGTLLHVDVRLPLGSSGGAVVDLDGKLIGLTTSLAALEGYETSVGYVVPMNEGIRKIVRDLLRGYEVEFGYLGINPGDALANEMVFGNLASQPSAARADSVQADSPASIAGLRRHDYILAVNGRKVLGHSDLIREIGLLGAGSTARLTVWRAGNPRLLQLPIKLSKRPVLREADIVSTTPRYPAWRGISVDYSTGRFRYLPNQQRVYRAVAVASIEPGSPADDAELQEGHFIARVGRTAVQTPDDFVRAVASQRGPVTLMLHSDRQVVIGAPSDAAQP